MAVDGIHRNGESVDQLAASMLVIVSLTSNVLAKTAIQIFGSYPSLQAMLDRITELERELESANKRRQEWGAGIKAILQIVQLDRPRYRSKAAWHIRQCLESIEGRQFFLKNRNQPRR